MGLLWTVLVIVLLGIGLIVYYIKIRNRLFDASQKVENGWGQIEVVLQQRGDLLPNLVATVKGYAKHEAETLEQVIAARSASLSGAPATAMEASGEISSALSRLLAVSEAYPELKADKNFLELQTTIKDQENKIGKYRQFYNDTVLIYNRLVGMFPSSFVAKRSGYTLKTYLEAPTESREVPKVSF